MSQPKLVQTATAGAAVGQYLLLQNSSGNVIVATAATQLIVGCSQATSAASGETLPMYLGGQVVKLRASAAIAKHARVMATTDGEIVTFTSGAGVFAVGIALEAAAADQDVIEVWFCPSLNAEDA